MDIVSIDLGLVGLLGDNPSNLETLREWLKDALAAHGRGEEPVVTDGFHGTRATVVFDGDTPTKMVVEYGVTIAGWLGHTRDLAEKAGMVVHKGTQYVPVFEVKLEVV